MHLLTHSANWPHAVNYNLWSHSLFYIYIWIELSNVKASEYIFTRVSIASILNWYDSDPKNLPPVPGIYDSIMFSYTDLNYLQKY